MENLTDSDLESGLAYFYFQHSLLVARYTSPSDFILGVQLCFRRFFPKFEALFLKSDYLFMIRNTARR